MTATCRACGAQVVAGSVYCHQCGRPLADGVSAAPGTAPVDVAAGSAPTVVPSDPPSLAAAAGNAAEPAAAVSDAGEERVLWEGSYSAKAVLGTWVLAALITIGVSGLGMTAGLDRGLFLGLLAAVISFGGITLYVMYSKLSVHYRLTSLRFIHQAGLIRRVTDRIEVIDVDDVAFSQGPFERLVGVGTIKIMSSDNSHSELFLEGIDQVAQVANLIDEARRAERRRRGLYIEAI